MTGPLSGFAPAVGRYLTATAVADILWEFAQMPLYTLWQSGSPGQIVFAALHCTAGDIVIAAIALAIALVVLGSPEWPNRRYWRVGAATIAIGAGYTIFSESLNTARGAWSYSDSMPTVPWLGTGLAPLAQWLLIPALALFWVFRTCVATPRHP
jgi:hypothetical protein